MASLESLPAEIVLNIAQFLSINEIVNLQYVSKRFLRLCRDDVLWREQAYLDSSFLDRIRRRRALIAEPIQSHDSQFRELAQALAHGNGLNESRLAPPRAETEEMKAQPNEKIRLRANWDPSYAPSEKVNWYDEYIARHAPISTSWFEQPRNRESAEREYLEVRGMALYSPPNTDSLMIVSPLDDGSIAIWNLSGLQGVRQGSIIARSKSGILAVDHTTGGERSRKISTGVVECISIDSALKRAYVAVQSSLVEIDLDTLTTISVEKFPFSITTLSEAKNPTPITVGTNLSLYLHDFRTTRGSSVGYSSAHDRVESQASSASTLSAQSFRSLLNPEPVAEYAPLYQPGPLSILHLPSSDNDWNSNSDIYVAGRFPSILNYDRRNFPKLRGTIHSGARLCSMTSLPYPFASLEKDLARRGELTVDQVAESKARPGKTLIACGEYNSKGSLEMYGLSSDPRLTNISSDTAAGSLHHSVLKNRQTSSSSKLLSVALHGTRLVVSDGGGNLKWLERDGFTEVRRWNIAHGSIEAPRGIFGSLGESYMDSGSGDIVIKILESQGNLIVWTGEKIGIISFSSKPGYTAKSFENEVKSAEESRQEREEQVYSQTMRRALEHQANEVRYVRGLGLAGSLP